MVAVAAVCFACLFAVPASADEFATKDDAVALVKKAIARVQEVGIDKAKADFMDHSGPYVDRDLYLVVLDKDGMRIAHGQNPKLVGMFYYDSVDANGTEYGKDAAKIVSGAGTGWISFLFKDPITGKLLPKTSYVEKSGDYVFIAGVYAR
jgi:signal transduction histidine kinase